MVIRCIYLDLDGTLLGRGASLLHDGDGRVSLLGVRAIEACLRADVEVVLMSGRRRNQVGEDARLLGATSYIYEAGCVLVFDGEEHWLTGAYRPGAADGTVHDQIERSGAPALLLDRYPGRLEYHEPWHTGRQISHLFRGRVDAAEVDALLAEHGHGDLRLVDNGVVGRRSPALAAHDHVRGYHLIPAGASKAAAVAGHMRARGLRREETFGVGDSREDLATAAHVGEFWLVANALERDPTLRGAIAAWGPASAAERRPGSDWEGSERDRRPSVRVAEAAHGAGVYEAVITTLAVGR